MHTRIPKMRDPSKWKFPKRGIPQFRNFQNEGSLNSEIPKRHSRKWWPPIRGGTLQSALLWLENVKWDDYFCKKSISHINYWWKSKRQYKKRAKPPKKNLFVSCLSQNSWNEGSLKMEISKTRDPSKWKFPKRGIPQNRNFQNEGLLEKMANRWRRL